MKFLIVEPSPLPVMKKGYVEKFCNRVHLEEEEKEDLEIHRWRIEREGMGRRE